MKVDIQLYEKSGAAFNKRTYDLNTTKLMNTYKSHTNQYFNFMTLKYNYRIKNSCKLLILYKFCTLKIVPQD